MQIIIWWGFFSFAVAWFAHNKGRSGVGFGLLAFIISPLMAFIVALLVTNLKKYPRDTELNRMDYEGRAAISNMNTIKFLIFLALCVITISLIGLFF